MGNRNASKRLSEPAREGWWEVRKTVPTATQSKGGASRTSKQSNRKASASRGASRSNGNGSESGSKTARAATASARSSSRATKKTGARTTKASPRTRGRSQTSAKGSQSKASSKATGSRQSSGNGHGANNGGATSNGARHNGIDAAKAVGVSVATGTLGAAAGIAGGILLGRTVAKRPRKVLGVKLPQRQNGFADVARSVSAAGKQFGKLASEVRVAREKAEEIGKALT